MPYGQIIELMIALILIESAPENIALASGVAGFVLFFTVTTISWVLFCCWNNKRRARGERALEPVVLEWLALVPLIIDFYFLGLTSLLKPIALQLHFPSLIQIIGLVIFLIYLAISWLCQARAIGPDGFTISSRSWFVRRFNLLLPILFPYVLITIIADILTQLPIKWIRDLFTGPYASFYLLLLLIGFFLFALPGLVRRLWRCKPLPKSQLRQVLEEGLERQGVRFSDILIWPVGEAMACTAAVIGIIPGFRYVLLTPCLMNHLSIEEIEAVIAHEAEHVRRKHILWYLFFLVIYSLILFEIADPLIALILSRPYVVKLLMELDKLSPSVTALLAAVPLGLLTLFYFRFVLGFFMRNFERQADMAVFKVQGHPFNLISALKKVAILSGIDPRKPNWHHYSILERITFLEEAFHNKEILVQHDRRLFIARSVFITVSLSLLALPQMLPTQSWQKEAKINAARLLYDQFIKHKKKDPIWFVQLGGLFFENKMYEEAEKAYKAALEIDPDNAEAMNNLAWLYIKSEDKKFYHPKQALLLAMAAARKKPVSYILDTLAECFFVNGYVERAIDTERLALKKAKQNKSYYQRQLDRYLKALSGN